MRYTILLASALISGGATLSQTPFFNSGLVILKAIQLKEEQKYAEAIELYKSVPRNDTNYTRALYEMTLSQMLDSNYTAALYTAGKALETPSEYELDLLIAKGTILDDQQNSKGALEVYETALKKYPQAQNLLLNKAITLMRLEQIEEAETILKNLAITNPYYASVHMRLANCALKKGRIVPATMSLFTYLLLSPNGMHASASINWLGAISKSTDDIIQILDKRGVNDEIFHQAEQIIVSKIALDKGYKLQSSLDDPIVRQLQVLMEIVQYTPQTNDFWMEYYVPLLKQIFSNKTLHPLVNQAFSSVNLEAIQKYNKNNKKEIGAALNPVVNYLNQLRATRVLTYEQRKNSNIKYHFNNNDVCVGTGLLDQKGQPVGDWTFYHKDGNIKSIGTFLNDGKKTGRWLFYFNDGTLNAVEYWANGAQTGKDSIYFANGVLSQVTDQINGKLNGEKKTYYSRGSLKSTGQYKNDKQNGSYTEYKSNGTRRLTANFNEDQLHGVYQVIYDNGKLQTECNYKAGKLDGVYKTFYESGDLKSNYTYLNGKLEGQGIDYYKNGRVKEIRTYKQGDIEGASEEFTDEGVLISTVPYQNGKADGAARYYDDDKSLFSTFEFEKGILKKASYFDKSGKEISTSIRKKGHLELTGYTAEGVKSWTTVYNDAGEKINQNIIYYTSGAVKETNEYKKGMLEGYSTGYYQNGQLMYKLMYAADEKTGSYIYYHSNAQRKLTGNYLNGNEDGEWIEYNEKGNVISRYNYVGGEMHGYNEVFYQNGKLDYEEQYQNGWLNSITTFDTSGRVLHKADLSSGNGLYQGLHPNGKKRFECLFQNGELDGAYTSYFFDESPYFTKTYKGGLLHGPLTEYDHGGVKTMQGAFDHDKRTGDWKYYTKEGILWKEAHYVNNELDGKVTTYYASGVKEREISYKNNEMEGEMKRYNEGGELMGVSYYKNDVIVGYSYLDKENKLVPRIPIIGGTGKLLTFYPNGNKAMEINYEEGLVHGSFKQYHPNGELKYQTSNTYGETNGELLEFYPGGKPQSTYMYVMNQQDGPFKEYYPDGRVKEEGNYYNGTENGTFNYYDAAGKLTAQRIYYYGKLLKITK